MLQGSHRLQRGLNYMAYVDQHYSTRANRIDTQPNDNQRNGTKGRRVHGTARNNERDAPVFLWATYNGGHNNSAFGFSAQFAQWAFVDE